MTAKEVSLGGIMGNIGIHLRHWTKPKLLWGLCFQESLNEWKIWFWTTIGYGNSGFVIFRSGREDCGQQQRWPNVFVGWKKRAFLGLYVYDCKEKADHSSQIPFQMVCLCYFITHKWTWCTEGNNTGGRIIYKRACFPLIFYQNVINDSDHFYLKMVCSLSFD